MQRLISQKRVPLQIHEMRMGIARRGRWLRRMFWRRRWNVWSEEVKRITTVEAATVRTSPCRPILMNVFNWGSFSFMGFKMLLAVLLDDGLVEVH